MEASTKQQTLPLTPDCQDWKRVKSKTQSPHQDSYKKQSLIWLQKAVKSGRGIRIPEGKLKKKLTHWNKTKEESSWKSRDISNIHFTPEQDRSLFLTSSQSVLSGPDGAKSSTSQTRRNAGSLTETWRNELALTKYTSETKER